MSKMFYLSGLAMALLASFALRNAPVLWTLPVAAVIVLASWWLFGRTSKPKPVDYGGPIIPNTRRWARFQYHNKFISLDELQQFYDSHPENEDFGDE